MSAMRTMKVVVILLALMAGLPTIAFAHAGHKHAAPVAASGSALYSSTMATQAKPQTAKNFSLAASRETPAQGGLVFEKRSSGKSKCTPGSCCCQGASSGGSGHCCSFGITTAHAYDVNQSKSKSFRLALLVWPYPDLIFGLDRPPKA